MRKQIFIVFALIALVSVPAFSAPRTFVSTSGLDTNPCTRTAPCRNFTAAIAQTDWRGEVYVLDSGGYGSTLINRSVTIRAEGVTAGVSVFSGDGIDVFVGAADAVTLHGLTINGLGGTTGVSFQNGGILRLEDVSISNFTGAGIDVNGPGDLFVNDSIIRENAAASANGLFVHPSTGVAFASIDGSRFEHNFNGVMVGTSASVVARGSVAAGSANAGFASAGGTAQSYLFLEGCVSAHNHWGVLSTSDAGSQWLGAVVISNAMVYGNDTGLAAVHGVTGAPQGTIVSMGNNSVDGNAVNGSPSSTLPRV